MAYWLLKTEPQEYSYKDLEQQGRAVWNGVKNPLALKYLRTMQPQDEALIYHTGKERAVVGKNFKDFDLIRLPRLSVVPVADQYWQQILQLES
jgi:predicted RNA-binding protein with PUA-like domain